MAKSFLLFLLLTSSLLLNTVTGSSSFVITEHKARNVKCFQSYNDESGLVERSICWHDREFYADRWHDWPCEIDCDKDVHARIYLEDYTVRYQQLYQGEEERERMDSEWQLVTYLHKGTGDCKNEHDEDGWSVWACAEIKTV
ncbi:hypothetical protein BGZ59_011042 [Podila verticillata]|nr:hypothetical protein BGZ59_011042 [Podila verticillata]KFH65561.1 hypothetical protein MVEG_09037 [Podila verticillata NRRL 6337]